MKKIVFVLMAFLLFSSHDMFLKLDTYFIQPNTNTTIKLFNGTFDKSENVIDRNRMIDVSIVGNGVRTRVDTTQWYEQDSTTFLKITTGDPGTWIAGVSTKARNIEMAAEAFNGYLDHDGVLDMLEWRKQNDALDKDAVEKYSKHVKTLFQVGPKTSEDWKTVLGYPIEFVPMNNPYDLHPGEELKVKLLRDGAPLANQLVYAAGQGNGHSHEDSDGHTHDSADAEGHTHDSADADGHTHEHSEGGEEEHHHHDGMQLRTDQNGKLSLEVSEGIWYLRTIHLVNSDEPGLTHESNWATLTFEIGHGHSHEDGGHSHEGEAEDGIPSMVYWIGSVLLLGILFFWFNRKK